MPIIPGSITPISDKYPDGHLAIFHGPRCLAQYDASGKERKIKMKAAV